MGISKKATGTEPMANWRYKSTTRKEGTYGAYMEPHHHYNTFRL